MQTTFSPANLRKNPFYQNIWKLYLIKAARFALFMMPIIVLYFQNKGLSMTQIMILQSIFAVVIFLLEIPSGYLADVFSRKSLIFISLLFAIWGDITYAFSDGFWGMLLAEVLLAVAGAFLSGADSAMLYDSLKQLSLESEHKKFAANMFAASKFSETISAIVGGLVAAYSMEYTFYLSALVVFLVLPLAATLKEPPRKKLSGKDPLKEMLKIIKFALHSNKQIKWLIIFGSVLATTTLVAVWMMQPLLKERGLELTLFGWFWAGYNLLAAFVAKLAHPLEEHFGFRKTFLVLSVLPVASYLVAGLAPSLVLTILGLLGFAVVRALAAPILQDYIHKRVNSTIRATVLSVYSLASSTLFIILSPFIGWLADVYSLPVAFVFSGVLFGVMLLLALVVLYSSNSAKSQESL